jgi:hypothetical protein
VCCPSSSWGLGAGGLVACRGWWSCTPIAPPRSTARAVARGSGWVCCCRRCRSTRDPPHEQLLVRLEAAGGSSWRPGAIQRRRRVVTRYLPSEQSCAGVEAGAKWSIVVVRCWGLCDACFGGLGGLA